MPPQILIILLTNYKLQNEKCIKPFIDACDVDQDGSMNSKEWCRCFEKTDRPCAAVRRRLSGDLIGNYAPDCDVQGFYKPTQCHNSVGVCWCVDKHGVEFANTRTRGKPNCGEFSDSFVNFEFFTSLNCEHFRKMKIYNDLFHFILYSAQGNETPQPGQN
jgi:hypothetical protein